MPVQSAEDGMSDVSSTGVTKGSAPDDDNEHPAPSLPPQSILSAASSSRSSSKFSGRRRRPLNFQTPGPAPGPNAVPIVWRDAPVPADAATSGASKGDRDGSVRFDTQSAYSMSIGLDPKSALDYQLEYVVGKQTPEDTLEDNKSLGSASMSISDAAMSM